MGLTPEEFGALARQGFVGKERRGEKTYYKLRFRSKGRQVVRYIGSAAQAAKVNEELSKLQSEAVFVRQLKANVKAAKRLLREVKKALCPTLMDQGFQFHGLAIRRPRTSRPSEGAKDPQNPPHQ